MAKTVSLTLPLTRADLADLEVGDEVLLSGPVYTMRDAGHERALQCLEDTGRLPFDLEGATLFYAGPTPAAAGRPLGSVGPTTASRMDFATPRLFEAGHRRRHRQGQAQPRGREVLPGNRQRLPLHRGRHRRAPGEVRHRKRAYRLGRPRHRGPKKAHAKGFPHLRRRRHQRRRPLPRDRSRRPISTAKSTMREALGGCASPTSEAPPRRTPLVKEIAPRQQQACGMGLPYVRSFRYFL